MNESALPLWPEGAPGAVGDLAIDCPQLTVQIGAEPLLIDADSSRPSEPGVGG